MSKAAGHRRKIRPLERLGLDLGPLLIFFAAFEWAGIFAATAAFMVAILLALACTVSLWAGVRLVGVQVGAGQVIEPVAGTLPLLALFTGLSLLSFGLTPRLTPAAPVTLAVLSYLLDTFGAMLHWPAAVLALSPFHHLARLPGAPMTVTAIAVMTSIGLTTAVIGVVAFGRRDLRGG